MLFNIVIKVITEKAIGKYIKDNKYLFCRYRKIKMAEINLPFFVMLLRLTKL